MKKLLFLFLIMFTQLQAFGFEDYILLSDKKVNSVYSKNENIISVQPFYTIDNGKETIILKAKKDGETQIIIETDDKDLSVNVVVTNSETTLSEAEGITFLPIDFMSEPPKPAIRGK